MKKNTILQISLLFLLIGQYCFAQVDVVYKDLVWSDEFNTNGAVDPNNWFHQTQLPAGTGWFNGEVQHYTNLPANSFVDNGFLNIVSRKEKFTDQGITKEYTSARLNSKFAFKYGRVDVRAKLPIESGTWPAIWMLGKNTNEDGGFFDTNYGTTDWPACGEIDIMEQGIFHSENINFIQSALHTPSSNGNTINKGGIVATDIANTYHVYSMNWSPNEISFLLDDVIYYTYNPSVKDASTWPFDKEQYLLLNVAMGGYAGMIAPNFVEASMEIDYVRVYQNTVLDIQPPTNFTATVGTITGTSVELLLNAVDDSGTVVYNVDYGNGVISTSFPSGVQKSMVIPNLSPNTNYTFTVSATDATGNISTSNILLLTAKTTVILQCAGTASEASQGSFSVGYKYAFETLGTDVKITFELLDADKVGVVAYLWKQFPFSESPILNASGMIFTKTITGQTIGQTINYAVKFAYAGGLSVTKYFSYVVGSNCLLGLETASESKQICFPNPVENRLSLQLLDEQNEIVLTDSLGRKLLKEEVKSTHDLDMSTLTPGIYFLNIKNSQGVQNVKIIKK